METKHFSPGAFRSVIVGGNYKVRLVESEESGISITTDENLFRFINIDLLDDEIQINNVHKLKSTRGIFVEIRYSDLEKIVSTGSSSIEHEGTLVVPELEVDMTGTGSVRMAVEAERFKLNLSGAGLVELMGMVEQQEITISGAGGYQATELVSNNCHITLSGLGGAKIHVINLLDATITGVGGIVYSGRPKIIEKQITGFGKIKHIDESSQ
jgi:hypothetical protein